MGDVCEELGRKNGLGVWDFGIPFQLSNGEIPPWTAYGAGRKKKDVGGRRGKGARLRCPARILAGLEVDTFLASDGAREGVWGKKGTGPYGGADGSQ